MQLQHSTSLLTSWLAVILYYDYLLTFSMEIERFWTFRRISSGSFFFFFNRYLAFFGNIPIIFVFFWRTEDRQLKIQVRSLCILILVSMASADDFLDVGQPLLINRLLANLYYSFGSCNVLQAYHQFFAMISQVVIGSKYSESPSSSWRYSPRTDTVLLIMRVYALYQRSRKVLIFLTLAGSTCTGFALVSFSELSVGGC